MPNRIVPTLSKAAILCFAALGVPAAAAAQIGPAPASVEVVGRIVDAVTGTAMGGATVVLEPEVAGVFPGAAAGSGFVAATRSTTTDSTGRYRFDGLTPGPYRLHAARYGYRPYTVLLELGRGGAALSVGLEAEPIALEPLRSRATQGARPYVAADPFGPDADLSRLLVADLRRRFHLSTDVRELTHADVVEGGLSLGEPDLFRALQRLPGVTTRSDYTAALWTRGAPWSQTRVYYDGVPLFNPLHALGMIGGISSSAVGTVWFHPGVRPAAMGEGAAGVLDLRSRPAAGLGEVNVQVDASLATAGMALDQRVLDGRGGWMLSGRRSYLDWLTRLAERAAGRDGAAELPYHFTETAGRIDGWISDRHAVEASWLWEGDELTSAASDPTALRARWGNGLARASWSARMGQYAVQHTIGGSRHHGAVRSDTLAAPTSAEATRRSETGIDYLMLRGALWPADPTRAVPRWSLGYELVRQRVRYHGPVPLPVPTTENMNGLPSEGAGSWPDSIPVTWEATLPVVALWGERRWSPTGQLSILAGLRVEGGGEVRDALPVRVAPRLTIRYAPAPELALSAGLARVFQYSQAVAPGGVQLASLVSTDAWLLAGPGVPSIRSHLATAGLEVWLAPDRVATLNTFGRFADGVVIPNPAPGPVRHRAPTLVVAQNGAAGVEASVRQLAGPVTGSVAYTIGRSVIRAQGREFPSSADRTHVLSATGMVAPIARLRVGAAFTAATGVPFTRAVSTPADCEAEPGCDPDGELPWAGEPNATRGPTHASLDLLLDWSTDVAGLQLAVYGQIRNVLGRENATVYAGDGSGCLVVGCSTDELRNAYERGIPRLPVIGIRVRR